MTPAPLPADETARLAALREYAVLDTPPEMEFNDVTGLAAQICGTPIATISLIDEHRQWFKSKIGLSKQETSREEAFCAHALNSPEMLLVPDAMKDARFADNPSVTGDPHIRFYAGAPLITPAGHVLGTLCVIDRVPRELTTAQQSALQVLSRQVMVQLQLRGQTLEMSRAQSEQATLFNLSDDLLAVVSFDGQLEQVNPAWTRTLGWTAGELVGRLATDFILPEDRERTLLAREELKQGRSVRNLENRYRCKDGAYRWLSWNSRPLLETRQVFAVARDITERHVREGQLRLLETSVARLNDSVMITEAFPLAEPGPRIIFVNDAFERLSGYRREEIIGRTPRILQGPGTSRDELDRIRQALQQKEPIRSELINYAKDGTEYWVELSVVPVVSERGEVTHFVAIERDISERKQAEEAMRRNSARLTGIVDALQEIATSGLALQDILTHMATRAQSLTGAAGAIIEFVEGEEMVYRAASGRAAPSVGLRLPCQGSLSGLAVREGSALLCEDTETDDRVDRAACREAGVRSMVVAPLQTDQQVIGVLKIMSDRPKAFSPQDVSNLQILVESLSATIQRHRATELLRTSEEQYRLLFAGNPQPMWVYDLKSLQFLAVNDAALQHYGYTEDEFLSLTIMDIRPAQDAADLRQALAALPPAAEGRLTGIYTHHKKNGTLIQVRITSSSITFGDRPARLVLAEDITSRLQTEHETARANRALQMLSRSNEALIRVGSESEFLTAICRIAVEVGGMRLAWVGFAQNDAPRTIAVQAHAGVDDGYLSSIELSWAEDRPAGRGPAGRAVRDGAAVVIPDFAQTESFCIWLPLAQARGYRGVICLPLKDQGRTFGVFTLYLPEVRTVPPDELRLLQEMADNLAFGIGSLRVREERRAAQKEIQQQAALIDKATDAIFVRDLQHRITFWSKGAERLYGWTATEAVGQSLDSLLRIDRAAFVEAERAVQSRGEWSGEIH